MSNDGKCLLASCLDSKARLLETDTGELLNAYTGHEATSMRAEGRLSHDDACVLSTSEDGRVLAWDIVQAVMVRQFKVSDTNHLDTQALARLISHAIFMLTQSVSEHFSRSYQVFSSPVTSIDYHPHGRCSAPFKL